MIHMNIDERWKKMIHMNVNTTEDMNLIFRIFDDLW